MASPLIHVATTVTCQHGGPAVPSTVASRVLIDGKPAVTQKGPWSADCPLAKAVPKVPFCVTGTFVVAAQRVRIEGSPALLVNGATAVVATGTPLRISNPQQRVLGT